MVDFFSSWFHFFLPAKCDFCEGRLKGKDFNRLCLSCIAKAKYHDNKIASLKCEVCYHPIPAISSTNSSTSFQTENDTTCSSCAEKPFFFSKHKSCFYNDFEIQDFFYSYKFSKNISYSYFFSKMILRKDSDIFIKSDYLIPITLLSKDILKREFCPVLVIVKKISKTLKKPYKLCVKKNKKKYTQSQHSQNKDERENQITGKYLYLKKYRNYFDNKTVMLVDDVFTTGATLNYVAKLLVENNTNVKVIAYSFVRSYLK